ncbi:MAG: hypothetical protein ACLQAH_15675 [Limisphaerales bacterium]
MKDFLRLVHLRFTLSRQGVPLSLLRGSGVTGVTDFVAKFILGSGDNSRLPYGIDRQQVRTP